jgi:hypothetical protein
MAALIAAGCDGLTTPVLFHRLPDGEELWMPLKQSGWNVVVHR